MLTLPGLVSLIVFILARPFDFVPALGVLPFLYIFFGMAVLGFLLDLARNKLQWRPGLHLPWAGALVLWALFTSVIRDPSAVGNAYQGLLIPFGLYFLIAHGVADFRSFSLLAGVFLACTVVVSAACVYQGLQPFRCVAFEAPYQRGSPPVLYGRDCADLEDCRDDTNDGELTYQCEKVGLAGSVSMGHGRVCYTGVLNDPNESALAVSVGVPIAIGRYQRRRNLRRLLTLCVTIVLAGATVIMSQSRGGQLVFLSALGVYFLRRYRWKGLAIALLLALPAVLYGGRTGAESDASATERLGYLAAGIEMFKSSPLLGVGHNQFNSHYSGTAHNSYVLAPAELGVVGMTLWAMMLWISIKVGLNATQRLSGTDDDEARTWGQALFATVVSFSVGVFFLSFNYHYLLWCVFGLAGAYHKVVAQQQTGNLVRVGFKDVALVAGANLTLLVVLRLYLRTKGL